MMINLVLNNDPQKKVIYYFLVSRNYLCTNPVHNAILSLLLMMFSLQSCKYVLLCLYVSIKYSELVAGTRRLIFVEVIF